MVKVVSEGSADKYAGQNSTFALYCYKSADLCDLLLEPWFIEGLHELRTETKKKNYARKCCLKMSPEDDNCPFILSNLTFAHFSHYLTMQKAAKGKGRGMAMSLSNATYEQTQIALKHLFRMSKYKMEMSFLEELKQFLLGMKLGWKCRRHGGKFHPEWLNLAT